MNENTLYTCSICNQQFEDVHEITVQMDQFTNLITVEDVCRDCIDNVNISFNKTFTFS